jgi:ribosomal protein S7
MKVRSRQYYFSNYYKVSNGIYNSYWLGKLSNVFMFSGNKKTIDTAIKNTFSFLKLKYNVSPLEIILEGLEKIKPVFSLKYVTIAGKRREFPKLLSKHKQFQMSVA